MIKTNYRIGQIVPSSNTTMETEIPAMLRAREAVERLFTPIITCRKSPRPAKWKRPVSASVTCSRNCCSRLKSSCST